MWDVFISYAHEDREAVAAPLARILEKRGLRVWIDQSSLRLGDSLRRKIDEGLAQSRFGAVVLSDSFFAKNWPQSELSALFARESAGRKVILPIWHGISHKELLLKSPLLADRLAVRTTEGLERVADEVFAVCLKKGGTAAGTARPAQKGKHRASWIWRFLPVASLTLGLSYLAIERSKFTLTSPTPAPRTTDPTEPQSGRRVARGEMVTVARKSDSGAKLGAGGTATVTRVVLKKEDGVVPFVSRPRLDSILDSQSWICLIPSGTRANLPETKEAGGGAFASVTIIEGPCAGKKGWVMQNTLAAL